MNLTSMVVVMLLQSTMVDALNLPPFFTRDMNQHTLTENTPPGSVVYTLEGRDPEGSSVRFGIQAGVREYMLNTFFFFFSSEKN